MPTSRRSRPDEAELEAWRRFLHAHALLVDRLDAELRERHSLPLAWYDVLVQLQGAGGAMTMGALADALLIVSPSSCTRLVDRLAAAGLVRREADERDGRVRHAVLTPEGRAALRRAAPTHLAGIRRWFVQSLESGQADQLAAICHQILDGLET